MAYQPFEPVYHRFLWKTSAPTVLPLTRWCSFLHSAEFFRGADLDKAAAQRAHAVDELVARRAFLKPFAVQRLRRFLLVRYVLNVRADGFEEFRVAHILQKAAPAKCPGHQAIVISATEQAGSVYTFTYKAPDTLDGYTLYFGQLHSHTNISDGAGSVEDAFEHASNVPGLDFLAVTDHSNSFGAGKQ